MIRAAECAKQELPEGYWSFIEEHLPDYSRRDDVLRSDIFTRYLEGGEVQEVDYQNFFAHRTREEIEKEYWEGERKLFMEALSNSVFRKHPVEGAKSPSELVPQHFLKEKFHWHADGVYYVDADKYNLKLSLKFRKRSNLYIMLRGTEIPTLTLVTENGEKLQYRDKILFKSY